MTNVEFATIDSSKFERLIIENAEIREFANTVLRKELSNKVDKEISLTSLTGKERLAKFRKSFHSLENLIPHTDIASYLGITNISLRNHREKKLIIFITIYYFIIYVIKYMLNFTYVYNRKLKHE